MNKIRYFLSVQLLFSLSLCEINNGQRENLLNGEEGSLHSKQLVITSDEQFIAYPRDQSSALCVGCASHVTSHMRNSSGDPGDTNTYDGDTQVKHDTNVQSQPNQGRSLTDEDTEKIQEQIITDTQIHEVTESSRQSFTLSPDVFDVSKPHVFKVKSDKHNENSNPVTESAKTEKKAFKLNLDKKKAIDEMLFFFYFSGNDGHRGKRQIAGGELDQDPTDPLYKALAEESLQKYAIDRGITQPLRVAQVEKVSTQVVAGSVTRIDFLVSGSSDSKILKCHSRIWEQKWRNFKEITVTCENDGHRGKSQLLGGLEDQDPTKPQYKLLAEESLRKYVIESGIRDPLEVARVESVSTQVVAGSLTRIDFLVSGCSDSKINKCHSEIYERAWENFKEITVTCESDGLRGKRQVAGGQIYQDLNNPQYTASGISDSKILKCHTRTWIQLWRNIKKITITCESDGHRGKRQLLGGLENQDPTKPQYKLLAEESLRKYVIDSGIRDPLEVARVESVSTQVVAGSLTRIDFLVTGSSDSKINKCHSEIYERAWENFKEITVTCENDSHRGKRQVAGGQLDQDPSDPLYKALAEESLHKYAIDRGITQPLRVAQVEKVSTQVVAGLVTRIDFLVSGSSDSKILKCHSRIWEQKWRNFKEITVTCESDGHRGKRQFLGGLENQDPTKPQYRLLAEESLRKYVIDSGIRDLLEVARVESVSTQVVAGSLTLIDFSVTGSSDSKINKCHSEISERVWENFKEITVTCENDSHRGNRQLLGGLENQDPTKPQYKLLAEESLRKYVIDSGIRDPLEVARVESVSTQVVAGSLTRIDFSVTGSSDSKINKCHSEIYERAWENFKEITVTCENDSHRDKRQVTGQIYSDPSDPLYKALAEESLQKYAKDNGITQPLRVARVEKVFTHLVAGFTTDIDFLVTGSSDSKILKCHSWIWEQPWRKFKEITVTCESDGHRGKRQLLGGLENQDPTKPQYRLLAEESLRKYVIDSGIRDPLEVAQVESVSTQVVAGSLTRIDFSVTGSSDSKINKCHSEIYERAWENFKEITVTCENDSHRGKRQLLGVLENQDPTKPQYKLLAEESLRKYVIDSGIRDPLEVARVESVSTQVVAGSLTRIDFSVTGSSDSKINKCHSEIYERVWENFKEITVTCENDSHRGNRQVAGGQLDQDPTDPQYKELAEESLQKYAKDHGITLPLRVAQVEKVSTQVVSGILTRIDFLVTGSSDSKISKCHSRIWEQVWRKLKEITVTCESDGHRGKRQLLGGLENQDPTKPQYRLLAEESLRKYVIDSGIRDPLEVARVESVSTQVVAGSLTRIDFSVTGSSDSKIDKCHSEIYERAWENFKEITVTCENDSHRGNRQVAGGQLDQDPTDPQYKELAEESLQKYAKDHGITQPLRVAQVEKVSTQVVAGSLTRIDFLVSGSSDYKINKCHSEIYERAWENFKQIIVTCESDGHRGKRQLLGGLEDQDPTKPEYKLLAEESLRKYVIDSGIRDPLEVARVESVSTQVVAGLLTRIDFLVSGSSDSKISKCHSRIWEQVWRNFKEINVTCENDSRRGKRQVAGGQLDQDPSDPLYKALAEESLQKYAIDHGITQPLSVAQVEKVSTQVVAGSLTRIDFLVSGSSDYKINKCHSEIYERAWENFKEITVTCESDGHRGKRQLLGGLEDQDPSKPQYKLLAEESLRKYVIDSGIRDPLEVARVESVSTQVVAGLLTRIDFLVSGSSDSKISKCHSRIWEQVWRNFKEINVTCENDGRRGKRQVAGGQLDQDPSDPLYKALAEESLQKYAIDHGITQPLSVAQVEKVSTQVVAGSLTRIDFLVSGSSDYKINKCHSEIYERAWENFKQITVTCESDGHRGKRQLLGGLEDQDPTKPQYRLLAEESLRKYVIDSGIRDPLEVARVESVSTQVVAGSLTRIDFSVTGSSDSKINKCHSEIYERVWENFKEITVTCENDSHRGNRQVAGGQLDQDPTDPQYKELAEESLQKYAKDHGITQPLRVAQVEKVSTQVVSGILTRIDFLVTGSSDSKISKCHSRIWEQVWRKLKEITVTCESDGHRGKRQLLGGLENQDPTKPQYRLLAEESLRKYVIDSGIRDPLEVARVESVSTQVVAGSLTRIDFSVTGSSDSKIDKCHSEIYERAWENFKEITVTCENDSHRGNRQVAGGQLDQDPTDPQYKELAEESLQKYAKDHGITQPLRVAQVEKVSTQVVAGSLTRIDFLVSGSSDYKINKCHSEIYERAWENFKQITVTCESDGHRGKRQLLGGLEDQDPSKPQYKLLAEESLRKYVIDSGIRDPLEVARVESVSTQVVAGLLTRIDFLVSGSSDSKISKCHSRIWEQVWRNFKEINVTCENDGRRGKRQVAGGQLDQDPSDPLYKALAEESLQKYAIDHGITQPLSVAQVEKVSTQVVAGSLTRIDFLVSGSSDYKINKCHSEIYERAWENFKQITVTCESDGHRGKRQLLGGLEDQDPTKPQYRLLAEESLRKYVIDSGIRDPLEVARVESVSTQVVAGSLTRIDFSVTGSSDSKINKCHSEIYERVWENFKEITVTCENDSHRGNRQVAGGQLDQDPTDPQYKELAEESLQKYAKDHGITQPLRVAQVEKVSTQVVSGILTRIDFLVTGSSDSKISKCHSRIWEQVWRKLKDITVTCESDGHRGKRQLLGGLENQDPTKPQYRLLAEESLRKYVIDSGIRDPLEVARVESVSTQVVAGSLTRIDFSVTGSSDSKIDKCHSEIYERAWENFKEITVTCENDSHRGNRQVAGGQLDQDPTDPQYKELAEESLQKYAKDHGITQPLRVAQVEKVSTQVVAGSLTRIDFLVSGSSDYKINKCHSEIYERAWENFKQIIVTCESDGHRGKRQLLGGLEDQDPTKPEYKLLAEESLRKYVIDSGIRDPLEVARVESVSTQVVAGLLTRIDFLVSGSSDSKISKCHSRIWEQVWRNFKEINVTCENDSRRGKRQVAGGQLDQDPSDPLYKALAEESLQKYAIDHGITQPLSVAQVEKVSTQVVAGSLTRIDFLVSGSSDYKINKCHSEIYERAWENFKEITVTCESDGHRGKRQLLGGLEDQDPSKPQYKLLAEESLRKYVIDSGIRDPLEVARVESVSTQVVAGLLTRIDFLVSGSSDSKISKCHSRIWEQVWRNFKEINVTCENDGRRGKRQVAGGQLDQDPSDPLYKALAEESLQKYAIDHGITQPLSVAQVEKVSTQVVAGSLTRIDFLVSGSSDYKINKCHSEIYERAWENFKEITIICENDVHRGKRQLVGGLEDQDPTKPQYKLLAEESLRKYVIDSGIRDPLEVARVESVSTQVVAGSLTRIDFSVTGSSDSKINKCHSEIYERAWENFKEITVTCENDSHRGKRQVTGGQLDQDPSDPLYKALAEESLQKYAIDHGITQPLRVAQVEKVSTQVVAGSLTRIDFLVSGSSDYKINKCHSEIYERAWENFKQITVTCESDGHRGKRQLLGGLEDQDPTKPEYKLLAEESLRKYVIDSGIRDPLEVARVESVSTQVVAGLLTRIDFLVSGSSDSKISKCHSRIWEQVWRNFKEINVTCENDGRRGKRQVAGGQLDQDPSDPLYKALAEESLQKYAIDHGITQPLSVAQVEKVSTQVVAGSLTRIDFLVSGSSDYKINKCHSEIYERAWENFKEITVICENDVHRGKRQLVGGLEDQDPTKPQYKLLAEESLRKYVIDSGIRDPLEVARVESVSTQVVAGSLTRIDFSVTGSSDSKINKCHSEIYERAWENFKEITVTCENDSHRGKRQVTGGQLDQDPSDPLYKALAEESLQKYAIDHGITQPLRVAQVEKVSTQVVAGSLTRIDFLVSGSSDYKINKCHSEIYERAWENFKQITVTCESDGHRGKRQLLGGLEDQDPTKPEYKLLAEESLRKYVIDSGIRDPLEVARVESVSTQVVAGLLTRIDFLVSGSSDSKISKCHSRIWEQVWRNFKEINVTCENDGRRGKRQVAGGQLDQDPSDPLYKALAEESLQKYAIDHGITQPLSVAQVEKVSTQVVAGSLTRIDFLVSGSSDYKINKCHSEIYERAWENFKQITVTCESDGHRGKRQLLGGLEDQDPTKPQYRLLAEESLRKYVIDSGIRDPLEVARVESVSTQVVAGSLTRIDFSVTGSSDSKINKCHSEIYERVWENFKEITVTCENDSHRGNRQVAGGQLDQDPTDPQYKELAEESLQKYAKDHGITQPLRVAQVEKVSTQVVSGILTRIDFLVTGSSDSKISKCHSRIWEEVWRKLKKITVTCESDGHRGKRQLLGGLENQDPTKPQYRLLAEESLRKYVIDSGIRDPLEVAQVESVSTQVVAGSLTRIDFSVTGSSDSKIDKCHSEIYERAWKNFKEITVTCENDSHRGNRQVAGGQLDQDPTDPQYKELAEESLQNYAKDHGITQPLRVAQVEKVSTQVVAGSLTRIDFLVSGSSDYKINKCHSEIYERAWENFKQIIVTCESDGHRGKRQLLGGLEDQDPTKPEYKLLAEESLRKYVIDSGIRDPLEVARVESVSTQVVAGLLTRIDFLVSGSSDSKISKCHSRIWEQVWRNFKEINVTCENDSRRAKRQVAGGQLDQDPSDPLYKALAEESLQKYAIDHGITQPLSVAQVEKVSTQVVAGSLTRIDFLVSGSSDYKINKCHSEIYERAWENFKEITVICENDVHRGKRQLVGGLEDQDPTKPQYKLLAEESLRKYVIDSGIRDPLEVARVESVSTQVVAGSLTRIDFSVTGSSDSKINKCHSEIYERAWENFKEITVTCENDSHRGKRQVTGGQLDQDPSDPLYKALAEESLQKYAIDHGITQPLRVAQVEKVSTQVVAGSLTRIDFLVSGSSDYKINKCHSEIYERAWENFKQITVTCESDGHRGKRQLLGGLEDQDPTKPEYKLLAEESLRKYVIDSGIRDPLEVARVESVSTQVVAGLLTRIDFLVSGSSDSKISKCHSRIWEQVWRNFKEINVTCENDGRRGKRQVAGGQLDQDPSDPLYKALAEESLQKYAIDHGITQPLSVAQVEKVSTQVVAGSLTRIDFLVSGSSDYKINKCHSEIYERAWENFKQITVTCESDGHRGKRQLLGGLEDQDPTKPQYRLLAEESLRKYVIDSGIRDPLEVARVESVSTQVVAGSLTRIDFSVTGSSDSKINKCHSEIYDRAWENFKEITVTCVNDNHRGKRQVAGDELDQDPSDPQYKALAEESLEKYTIDHGITHPLRLAQVVKVSTQVVAGSLTRIDFLVSGSSDSKINKCHSEILEKNWENFKQITVTCPPVNKSAEMANELARQALKHIEAKYPHPSKQKVVRIFSLEKQVVAGIHYKMKIEVGFTDCLALSDQKKCKLVENHGLNKFCRVNVWIRPWTDHPPNFRVSCDSQEGSTHDLYHHVQAEHLFFNFLATYSPSYVNNYSEMHKRFEIFKNNIKKIHELNVHEKGTATYGVTRFSDLTYEEFSTTYMGLKPNLTSENQAPMKQADIPNIKVPDNFDWREYDAVTDVKDQGSCGSCWAFSVTGNIEGQWKMQSGQLVSLSEQELVDCDKLDSGCNGGLPDNAYRAIEQMGGLELESDYPYDGKHDKCLFNKTLAKVKINSAVNITKNETGMAQWLVHNGPISIGINAHAMQFYMGGISHPWKMLCNPTDIDHGVLIVGYGVQDYPLFNKKLPYWIIKNSWGKSWGEQGYYRVYRGDGTCGVNQMASSAVI